MHYQGFIFDFNGTLYRDDAYQKAAWGVISSRLRGGRALTEEEMVQHVNGWPGAAVFRYLLGRPLPQQEVWRLLGEKEAIYRELCQKDAANFRLIAGAEDFLDALKARGVPMTIATGSEIVNVRFFMEQFRLDRWFALERIVYDDGQLPGKPNPEIYQKAAANLGLRGGRGRPSRGGRRPRRGHWAHFSRGAGGGGRSHGGPARGGQSDGRFHRPGCGRAVWLPGTLKGRAAG